MVESSESSELSNFMEQLQENAAKRISRLHLLAKKIWTKRQWSVTELQDKCLDAWDDLKHDVGCNIVPLIPSQEDQAMSNVIFGSGSFSTGNFQAQQYATVKKYAPVPPMNLTGLITNKSTEHGCCASKISEEFHIPLIELDFQDWYHNYVDKKESNPIRTTRYWFDPDDPDRPSFTELGRRFHIRQDQYHKALGETIYDQLKSPVDSVSARGYNFQFCSNIFPKQSNYLPHINDTHPADLRYLDPQTHQKLYAGWQSGAIEVMLKDKIHTTFHGSFIGVDYMDSVSQIQTLDEGALLALSEGVTPDSALSTPMRAPEIQNAMKIIDDYFFSTLEPTGLIFLWGITERPIPVIYQSLDGSMVIVKQRAIFVGNQFHSGVNAWGIDLDRDLKEVEAFLFP
ncbi:MAG: hypothetical protein ACTSWW_03250 [Promethearchaeota archaeon]